MPSYRTPIPTVPLAGAALAALVRVAEEVLAVEARDLVARSQVFERLRGGKSMNRSVGDRIR